MKRTSAIAGTVPAAPFTVVSENEELSQSSERGRKAILAGWLTAMAGIAGYVYSILHAPEETGLLEAIRDGGPLAWLSAALIVVGVGLWIAGNISLQRAFSE
jgi:hypothetical protein